jgi:hypothetical protein
MNAREELFYAARGDYMALVEGVRQAEDDEHTEVSNHSQTWQKRTNSRCSLT